ncbi:MAG: mannitol dehydrogenase family protein, partial [Burkholderiales bacterium]|nr:mannitol dehydrogenase family protein [Burkholderiales bacterium]
MTQPLSRAGLASLPQGVAAPAYDPRSLRAGIVHIGVGNFHRAHQAVYLDDLFALGEDHAFGIVGGGIRDADAAMRAALARQDYLTTVVAQEGASAQARVTAALIDFVDPALPVALVEALADPTIRICSLTVTEGGYCVDAATGHFDPRHPDIAADAAALAPAAATTATSPPSRWHTAFAPIVAALARRRAAGHDPFTVMSCDNLPGNGDAARAAVLGLAEKVDPGLAS